MGIFSRKTDNIAELQEQVGDLIGHTKMMQAQIDDLEQKFKQLRGLVNRKLYPDIVADIEKKENEKNKNLDGFLETDGLTKQHN